MDSEMDQAVSVKNFFVHVAGRTNGAHQEFVAKLKGVGHFEVTSPEESDYLLVFCPIVLRVGTDISEALENIPGARPTILVVMHHTFNPNLIVADSRRQVDNPNVLLTVDCLFREDKLLSCDRNDIAWFEIQRLFGISASQICKMQGCMKYFGNGFWNNRKLIGCLCIVVVLGSVALVLWIVFKKN